MRVPVIRHIGTQGGHTVVLMNEFDLPVLPSPGWEIRVDEGRILKVERVIVGHNQTIEGVHCEAEQQRPDSEIQRLKDEGWVDKW